MWLKRVLALVERGKFKKAASEVGKAGGADVAEALCQAGAHAAKNKRFREAEFFFLQALVRTPTHLTAQANLGSVYQEQGKLDQAAKAYREVLKSRPDVAMIQSNLGAVCHSLGRLKEAEQHGREAVRLDPDMVQANINLGVILKALGKLDEAEACQTKALKLAPNVSEIHCNLASLALERKQYPRAIQYCQDALRLAPDNYSAMANLAGALFYSGREQESLAYFEAATRGGGGFDGKGHVNYGLALQESSGGGRGAIRQQLTQDHIYTDLAEPIALFRQLTDRLPIPPSQSRGPLDWFADHFQPGQLYPAAWWQATLARFGDARLAPDKILRAVYTNVFGWSIPSKEALLAIADFVADRRISSYGAGCGYWEYLLAEHFGKRVRATDLYLGHRFVPMVSTNFASAEVDPDDVVFLSWILNDEAIVAEVLQLFERMLPGQSLVLVGDGSDAAGRARTCGTDTLFQYLDSHFDLARQLDLVRFAFLEDGVGLYHKR